VIYSSGRMYQVSYGEASSLAVSAQKNITYHLSSIIHHLSSIIYRLSSIIYHLSSIIYHLSSIIHHHLSSRLYQWSYVSGVIRLGWKPSRMTPDTNDHSILNNWSYVSAVIRLGLQPRRMTPDTYDHCTYTNGRMYQVSYG
jgi:hypothetical protein